MSEYSLPQQDESPERAEIIKSARSVYSYRMDSLVPVSDAFLAEDMPSPERRSTKFHAVRHHPSPWLPPVAPRLSAVRRTPENGRDGLHPLGRAVEQRLGKLVRLPEPPIWSFRLSFRAFGTRSSTLRSSDLARYRRLPSGTCRSAVSPRRRPCSDHE